MTSEQCTETASPVHHGTGRIEGLLRWGGHANAKPSKSWALVPADEEIAFDRAQSVEVVTRDRGYNIARRTDLKAGARLVGPIIYRKKRFSGSLRARAHAPLVLLILVAATALLAYLGFQGRDMFEATRWTKGQMFHLVYGGVITPILLLLWYVFLRSWLVERPALRRAGVVEVTTPHTLEDPNKI